jgi:hypothetical protein
MSRRRNRSTLHEQFAAKAMAFFSLLVTDVPLIAVRAFFQLVPDGMQYI